MPRDSEVDQALTCGRDREGEAPSDLEGRRALREIAPRNPEGVSCSHLRDGPGSTMGANGLCQKVRAQATHGVQSDPRAGRLREDEVGIHVRHQSLRERLRAYRLQDTLGHPGRQVPRADLPRQAEPELAPSILCRWAELGHFSMSPMNLRHRIDHHKPRRGWPGRRPTSHGEERTYAAFCALPGRSAPGRARWTS